MKEREVKRERETLEKEMKRGRMRGATKVKERISRKSRDRERDKSAVLPILPIQWILSFSLEVALILWPYLCHGILLLQNTKNPMSQKQLSSQSTTNKNIFGLL